MIPLDPSWNLLLGRSMVYLASTALLHGAPDRFQRASGAYDLDLLSVAF